MTGLRLYPVLARALRPLPYTGKFLGVAFVGTHVPLLALLCYLLARQGLDLRGQLDVLGVALLATLAATGLTLWAIHGLLEPVDAAREALRCYLDQGALLALPDGFRDAGGRLMRDVAYALRQLDGRLRELDRVATTDFLTGAMTRRAGEEALRASLSRVAGGTGTLDLLKLDVDRFKQVNDRFGHATGDACLRRLAEIVRSTLREGDWIARWGGDEFVVGIECAGDQAEAVVARLTQALEVITVPLPREGALALSVSVGHAPATAADTPGGLYERADAALYRAKATRPARHLLVERRADAGRTGEAA